MSTETGGKDLPDREPLESSAPASPLDTPPAEGKGRSHNEAAFVERFADYIETAFEYANWTKRDVARYSIELLFDDIGAMQGLLDAKGIDIDLYRLGHHQ